MKEVSEWRTFDLLPYAGIEFKTFFLEGRLQYLKIYCFRSILTNVVTLIKINPVSACMFFCVKMKSHLCNFRYDGSKIPKYVQELRGITQT